MRFTAPLFSFRRVPRHAHVTARLKQLGLDTIPGFFNIFNNFIEIRGDMEPAVKKT